MSQNQPECKEEYDYWMDHPPQEEPVIIEPNSNDFSCIFGKPPMDKIIKKGKKLIVKKTK